MTQKIRLSHGTTLPLLESILKDGLLPRNVTGVDGNFEDYPSGEDRVYLSNCYSPYFGMILGKPLIVEVEVDIDDLYPDEDFLSQSVKDVSQTHNFKNDILAYKHYAMDSLKLLGTVAHMGAIANTKIVNVCSFKESMLAVCDPTISLMNHMILGSYYEKLTNWFLGSDECPKSLHGGPDDPRLIRWFEMNKNNRVKHPLV